MKNRIKNDIRETAGKFTELGYGISLEIKRYKNWEVKIFGMKVYVNGEYVGLIAGNSLFDLFVKIKQELNFLYDFVSKDIEKCS